MYEVIRAIYTVFRMKNVRRDSATVALQYNSGSWRKKLDSFNHYKTTSNSLEDFLFKKQYTSQRGLKKRLKLVNCDKLMFIEEEEYLEYKAKKLAKCFDDKYSNVLEIGCGYGWNLAVLRLHGFKGELNGIDISSNGIKLSKEMSSHFSLNLHTQVKDIHELDRKFAADFKVDIVLIYQVLEQIPNSTEQVLNTLVEIFPKTKFLIIESAAELFPINLNLLLTRFYRYKQNYQNSVLRVCKNLAHANKITEFHSNRYNCSGKYGHESLKIEFISS
jgi:2-polyprenyl-3-methyl-5-hydroxy-6-metoxy-1,4-benzoquinol methylase